MTLQLKASLFASLTLAAFAITGCSESTSTEQHNPTQEQSPRLPPTSVVVSNAHPPNANVANVEGLFTLATGNVAYVAAAPGTWPGSTTATIRNVTRNGSAIVIQVIDGGFDPVAVEASQDDKIQLAVNAADGSSLMFSVTVPPRRPPIVIRTNPSKGRIDVALNVQIEVVFSEPIKTSSIAGPSVRLLKDGSAVQGTIQLSADGLSMMFTPETALEAQSNYTLTGTGLRDLDDEPLADPVLTTFLTASVATPAPAGVSGIAIPDVLSFTATSQSGLIVARQGDGYTFGFWRGTVTQPISKMGDALGFVMAVGVNNSGTVVGWGTALDKSQNQAWIHAVQWKAGTITDLGTLPGHNRSDAWAISNSGIVIGSSSIWDGGMESCCEDVRGVLWKNGVVQELKDFSPIALNDKGEILGWSSGSPAIWTDGVIQALTGGLFDDRQLSDEFDVVAINDQRQVAGYYNGRTFIWENGHVELLDNPSGCDRSLATNMDAHGRVVGYTFCKDAPVIRAAVWIDKKPLILPGGEFAGTINAYGEIFGKGRSEPQKNATAMMWQIITP